MHSNRFDLLVAMLIRHLLSTEKGYYNHIRGQYEKWKILQYIKYFQIFYIHV